MFNPTDIVYNCAKSAASTALDVSFNKLREHFHLTTPELKEYATARNVAYAALATGGIAAVMINPVTRVALCTFLSMSFTMTTILLNLMLMGLYLTWMGVKGISSMGSTAASILPSITSIAEASTIVTTSQAVLSNMPLISQAPEPFNGPAFEDHFDHTSSSTVESNGLNEITSPENLVDYNEQAQLENSQNNRMSLEQEVNHLENEIRRLDEEVDTTQVEEFDWDQLGREIENDPDFNRSVGSSILSSSPSTSPIIGGLLRQEAVAKNLLHLQRLCGPVEKFDSQKFLENFDAASTGSALNAGNISKAIGAGLIVYQLGKMGMWLYNMNQIGVEETGPSYASIDSSALKVDDTDRPVQPNFNDYLQNGLFY